MASRFELRRKHALKANFGITPEIYDGLLVGQGGVCAICQRQETARSHHTNEPKRLAVDHDHATGRVRGLLCTRCNSMLGLAADDPTRLVAAIRYLLDHQSMAWFATDAKRLNVELDAYLSGFGILAYE